MKTKELHWKQIPTTYATLRDELSCKGHTAVSALIGCVMREGGPEYMNYLVVAADCFERLSCLVYRSGGRFKKPPAEKYKYTL